MESKPIAKTADGKIVVATDAFYEHMKAHPEELKHVQFVAGQINSNNRPFIMETIDTPFIGTNGLVVDKKSKMFAVREGRKVGSRVSLTVAPSRTNRMTILMFLKNNVYNMITMWFGEIAEKEPTDYSFIHGNAKNDEIAKQRSIDFWSKHALAYDPDVMGRPYESNWYNEINKA